MPKVEASGTVGPSTNIQVATTVGVQALIAAFRWEVLRGACLEQKAGRDLASKENP